MTAYCDICGSPLAGREVKTSVCRDCARLWCEQPFYKWAVMIALVLACLVGDLITG